MDSNSWEDVPMAEQTTTSVPASIANVVDSDKKQSTEKISENNNAESNTDSLKICPVQQSESPQADSECLLASDAHTDHGVSFDGKGEHDAHHGGENIESCPVRIAQASVDINPITTLTDSSLSDRSPNGEDTANCQLGQAGPLLQSGSNTDQQCHIEERVENVSLSDPSPSEIATCFVTEPAATLSAFSQSKEMVMSPNVNGSATEPAGSQPVSSLSSEAVTSPDVKGSIIESVACLQLASSQSSKVSLSPCENVCEAETTDSQLASGNPSQAAMTSEKNDFSSEVQVLPLDNKENVAATAISDEEMPQAGADHQSVYYIKWITFGQSSVPIITQNENGPCPLLAIMNVLLLTEKVKLAPVLQMITSEQLMTYLGECIFENMPQNLSETTQANYEQNMQDAMGVMYKLQTGLDVNVRFMGVRDFEYTPELIIFDLLGISIYHGWLVDPQDPVTVAAVNQCSYNQLVEKIISLKHEEGGKNVTQALIAEQFLERSASQLTYHGLCELSSAIKDKELCVFFRNNHFSTLYKNNNELFLLVTDQGFLTESSVVWETLSNVDGDCHFVDASFRTYTKPAASTDPIAEPIIPVGSPEQIDHDYQVALFLQEEASALQSSTWDSGLDNSRGMCTDHELAVRLQEEENRRATEAHQRTSSGASMPESSPQAYTQRGHGSAAEGQRRRAERGDHKEEKSCSLL